MAQAVEVIPERLDVDGRSVALLGYEEGGPGLIHAWLERATGKRVCCFVNVASSPPEIDLAAERKNRDSTKFEYPTRNSFKGLPLITTERWVDVLKRFGIRDILIVLSEQREKLAAIAEARAAGFHMINAIHPTALIMEDAVLEDNVILHARAVVGYRSEIKAGAWLNTGAQVDHHAIVHSCAMIDPGVIAAGNVTIGACARIHTGAKIINRIRIGEDAVVGAGAVVIRDVEPRTIVVGVPAKKIRDIS